MQWLAELDRATASGAGDDEMRARLQALVLESEPVRY